MGIETLNPSNSNESQLSLRDPVRTCVPWYRHNAHLVRAFGKLKSSVRTERTVTPGIRRLMPGVSMILHPCF